MQNTTRTICSSLIIASFLGLCVLAPGRAYADDDDEEFLTAEASRIGIGVRLRQVYLPQSMLELFLEDVPGTASHIGYGLEFVREKGAFALVVGVEYESIAAQEGIWVDKGDTLPQDEPDYVEFDNFRWLTADVTFMWQLEIIEVLRLRYGAGLGMGVIMGKVLRTDYRCTSADTNSCSQSPTAIQIKAEEDQIPPVFPVVNVVVGAQLRPFENLAINIEGGIRSVPFVGTSAVLLF